MEGFQVIKKLGKGSFGNVYEVKNEPEVKNGYALKVIENEKNGIGSLRELDIMGRLRHPNLMHSEKIIVQDDKLGILMKKAETDLFHRMYDKDFNLPDRIKVLKSITEGLKFLHDSGYLHLDLKPSNILIFKDNIAKITDFGLSIKLETNSKYYPVKLTTVDHRPINVIDGDRIYTEKDDVWALGLIFLQVLSRGKSLFYKFKKKDFQAENVKERYVEKLSPSVIEDTLEDYLSNLKKVFRKKTIKLLKKMLKFNPEKRAGMNYVLKYFKDVNTEKGTYIKPVIPKIECNIIEYEGFDTLVRLCTRVAINLETFFLAADIYQRSLPIRRHSEDVNEDYRNIIYAATLSLYIAAKIVENYYVDPVEMAKLTENMFTGEDLLKGESALAEDWQGIFYPDNLFTQSSTLNRFNQAFEVSRNSFIYRKIDLEKWKELNDNEELVEAEYEKYTPFISFLSQTNYYKILYQDPSRKYIKNLYENDKKFFL